MPLHLGLPYEIEHPDLEDDEQVWIVKESKEAVTSYEEFLLIRAEYAKKVWACAYTGKAGLTYQEALEEEKRILPTLQQVPADVQDKCVNFIHHSILPLDQLAQRLSDELYLTSSNKENGHPDGKPSQPLPAALPKLSIPSIRAFIIKASSYNEDVGVWVVRDEYAKGHDLPPLTPDLKKKLKKERKEAEAAAANASPLKGAAAPLKPVTETPAKPKAVKLTSPKAKPSGAAKTPAAAPSAEGEQDGKTEEKKKRKRAPRNSGTLLPLEEEESKLKPGTFKHIAFTVLKTLGEEGVKGVTVPSMIQLATQQNLKTEWPENAKRNLRSVLNNDIAFALVGRHPLHMYALRAMPGVVPVPDENKEGGEDQAGGPSSDKATAPGGEGGDGPPKKKKRPSKPPGDKQGSTDDKAGDKAGGDGGAGSSKVAPPAPGSAEAVAAAQKEVKKLNKTVERLTKELAGQEIKVAEAKAALTAKEQELAATRDTPGGVGAGPSAAAPAPAPKKGGDAGPSAAPPPTPGAGDGGAGGDGAGVNSTPAPAAGGATGGTPAVEEGSGSKKAKERTQAKERQHARDKALEEARRAVSKQVLLHEGLKKSHASAVRSHEAAVKKLDSEKERHARRDTKEQEREKAKAAQAEEKRKEAERREREREARRAEALAAKRYPLEDLELLAELQAKAAAAGTAAPAVDVCLPGLSPPTDALATTEEPTSSAAPAAALTPEQQLPVELSVLGSWEAVSSVMMVSDVISNFHKVVGVKSITAVELVGVLVGATGGELPTSGRHNATPGAAESCATLSAMYTGLLKVVLEDLKEAEWAGRLDKRWSTVLGAAGEGAWPEVLRRFMLFRAAAVAEEPNAISEMDTWIIAAGQALGGHDANRLTPGQHAALLRWLLDEVIDTEVFRDALAARQESAAEIISAKRAELAEERSKLKEILEVERELKRKAAEAKLARAQAAAAAAGEGGAGGGSGEGGKEGSQPPSKKPRTDGADGGEGAAGDKAEGGKKQGGGKGGKKGGKGEGGAAEGEGGGGGDKGRVVVMEVDGDDDEDALVLPEELREYKGDPKDRKALHKFEAAQAAKLRELERARDARRREREEETRRRDKRKAELEERVASLNEAIERETERVLIRRSPLGTDRYHRRYWWGLAGVRSVMFVEAPAGAGPAALPAAGTAAAGGAAGGGDQGGGSLSTAAAPPPPGSSSSPQGTAVVPSLFTGSPTLVAVLNTTAQLEALIKSLDVRGVRELDLKKSLDKVAPTIEAAFKKAAAAASKAEAAAAHDAPPGAADEKAFKAILDKFPYERQLPARSTRFQGPMDGTGKAAFAKAKEEAAQQVAVKERAASEEVLAVCSVAGSAQASALIAAVSALTRVANAAAAAKVTAPGGGWKTYGSRLHKLLSGQIDPVWADDAAQQPGEGPQEQADGEEQEGDQQLRQVLLQLRLRVQEVEHLLSSATGEWDLLQKLAAEGGGDSSEEGEEEEEDEGEEEEEQEEEEGEQNKKKKTAIKKHKRGGSGVKHEWGEVHHSQTCVLSDDSPELVLEADDDPHDSMRPRRRPACMWHSPRERASWEAAVHAAHTCARIAYCVAVLEHVSAGPIELLKKAANKPAPAPAKTSGGPSSGAGGGAVKEPPAPVAASKVSKDTGPADPTKPLPMRAAASAAAAAIRATGGGSGVAPRKPPPPPPPRQVSGSKRKAPAAKPPAASKVRSSGGGRKKGSAAVSRDDSYQSGSESEEEDEDEDDESFPAPRTRRAKSESEGEESEESESEEAGSEGSEPEASSGDDEEEGEGGSGEESSQEASESEGGSDDDDEAGQKSRGKAAGASKKGTTSKGKASSSNKSGGKASGSKAPGGKAGSKASGGSSKSKGGSAGKSKAGVGGKGKSEGGKGKSEGGKKRGRASSPSPAQRITRSRG